VRKDSSSNANKNSVELKLLSTKHKHIKPAKLSYAFQDADVKSLKLLKHTNMTACEQLNIVMSALPASLRGRETVQTQSQTLIQQENTSTSHLRSLFINLLYGVLLFWVIKKSKYTAEVVCITSPHLLLGRDSGEFHLV